MAGNSGVDHLVILVRDLDAARNGYARLGFEPAPLGRHSNHLGTGNHCVMLPEGDYFEVLSVLAPTPANEVWRRMLDEREGLHLIVMRSDDVAADCRRLAEAGFTPEPPLAFSRPVSRPDGGSAQASFVVSRLPGAQTGGVAVMLCQHDTPELVWLPELMDHPNGARGLAALHVVHPDPDAVIPVFEVLCGKDAVSRTDGRVTVRTATIPITVAPPRTGEPGGPAPYAMAVRVRDPDAVAARLAREGIPYRVEDGAVHVPPDHAHGVALSFVAETAAP
jgi:catechol 2,3-dioxygenase-like lactoylglutathione lyase family enzyme